MTFLFLSLIRTTSKRIRAARPSITGTRITIQFGVATQFDSMSQNSVPAKTRQQPYRHLAANYAEQLESSIDNLFT